MRKVQRTIVLTGGGQAELVGKRLAQLLTGEGEPAEAVVIFPDGEADFAAGLRQISQVSNRGWLAGKSWTLDRFGEVAAYLVVDAAEPFPVEEVLVRLDRAVYKQLRLETSVLVAAIVSDLNNEAELLKLVGHGRGLVALSPVNEQGLCLADSEMLVTVCSQLLYTLITTPLRDSLEWLAELGRGNTASSMGLAIWEWSPAETQERLARRWVENALVRWRQPLPEGELAAVAGQAGGWLGLLEPAYLARHCTSRLPIPAPFMNEYVLPWQMHNIVPDGQVSTASEEGVQEEIFQLLEEVRPPPVLAIGEEMLDAFPVAGVSRLQAFIEELEHGMQTLQDRLVDRQELQEARLEALTGRRQSLVGELEALLVGWPHPSAGAWFRVAACPWRWPRLGWRYWQMRELVQALAQITAEMQQWERQQRIALATAVLYRNLEEEIHRFMLQVEEVVDMLAAMERKVAGESGDNSPIVEVLYWQLIESPAIEAEQAASAVGGLGRQLARPDDVVLEELLAAGRERMNEALALTAVDLLQLLYPTPDGLAGWWHSQWEAAAPLWHDDQALRPVSERAGLTLVCGAGVLALKQMLGVEEGQSRWIETDERRRIIILRARSIYLDGSGNDEVNYVSG